MPRVEKLLIFLASPQDVASERRCVEEVVEELNRDVASHQGVVLQIVSWEGNAFPGYGTDAQALINEQIAAMAQYSLFVGIMWNRVGTPTPRAASGTVEEFERATVALAQHGQPHIWFYFRQAPAKLDTDDELEQRKKLLAFRKRVQANGLPWSYKNRSDFRDKFRSQMIRWLNRKAVSAHGEKADDASGNQTNDSQRVEMGDVPAATYHRLLGREHELGHIMRALQTSSTTRAIVIVGLGGIGKTALAREVVERCRKDASFECVVWASFKKELFVGERVAQAQSTEYSFGELLSDILRQSLPATTPMPGDAADAMDDSPISPPQEEPRAIPPARRRAEVDALLKKRRLLIVLDNLETVADSEDMVARMFDILGQSRLIITSRHQVTDNRVYNVKLEGLTEEEGVTFLREESGERGVESVANADRSRLLEIHEATGGAPLAMKLVVGQLSRQPLKVVLEALKEASHRGHAYEFYRFVYRYSWHMLDPKGRMLLVDMSVFPPLTGGASEDVESVSQLERGDFWLAMNQLVRLSLVDKKGPAGEERFSLHPLTRNFIRSDITQERDWIE